ncbi:two-component system, OmpR family, phosphate regulon sensor histidine kinase PhoR [Mariniphaga anaerophila]|uniref:histidine kinase n=1 Tax=Mariniphaga anaerophila TaxID=1484053 RepID=A0A1M5BXT9_9BACT|nr:ATP-binding protein [Mariniphaga anaerophila]SHF47241.1 two-component system, OmpR family, phosphate regulon sensor histidine kinase PhoR [Mariniphaga anaerophila]
MKTYSSRQLTLYISVLLTVLVVLILFFACRFSPGIVVVIGFAAVFFLFSFFYVNYIINRYISDKIRPVYKTIKDLPLSGKKLEEKSSDSTNLLSNVKFEVEEWAKAQMKEIERLKELERYRKEFVGNVSHELKTPIFNIQGYILTLIEGGLEDPKINMLYLKRTEKSIDRMISIVEDLESINKLESGELMLNPVKFDIVKTAKDVFEMEQWQAQERDISLEIVTPPVKPIFVRADRNRILEVMTNLVVNAIKYGKKGGFVHISFHDLDDNIMVEISDNGIGIEKKNLPRVFERFYRVDKSRSREQGGTGLGLSIVKHIIEAHNQSINVRSVLDQGTTFNFTLEKAK